MSTRMEDLIVRAKAQSLSERELDEIAAQIEAGVNDSDLYDLLYVLGRSFSYKHEELIARYLVYPEDPWVARQALQVLCRFWGHQARYRRELCDFLRGVEWDDGFVVLIAASSAGDYLRTENDPEMLALLLARATTVNDESSIQSAALQALAVAAGTSESTLVKQGMPLAADLIALTNARLAKEGWA